MDEIFSGQLRFTDNYDGFRFGETLTWDSISQDSLNFYLLGMNQDTGGISSSYTVVPKYVAVLCD